MHARAGALPSDAGWKDAVRVGVVETVDVRLRFGVPALFVLHGHKREHEDHGMMLNVVVDPSIFGDGFEGR